MPANTDLEIARAALAQPELLGGIDAESDDSIRLYHLLCALVTFCDASGLDFMKAAAEVRAEITATR
jgi:hypothetical protein